MPASPIDYGKKIGIVGFAGTSRGLVPYKDPDMGVFGLNNGWQFVPEDKWVAWFELHDLGIVNRDFVRAEKDTTGEAVQRGSDRYEWLRAQPGPDSPKFRPIYMQKHHPEIPASVAWPREEINAFFKSYGLEVGELAEGYHSADYYTSTIAQMLATAICQGYGEIHLYGVDMLQDEEYYYQRAGCEYMIAFARGRGHRVYVPKQSALCQAPYVYGYSEPPDENIFDPIVRFIEGQALEATNGRDEAKCAAHLFEGGLKIIGDLRTMGIDENCCATCFKLVDYVKKAAPSLEERKTKALAGANVHEGARQMAEATKSWAKHFSRGGVLRA